MGDHNDSKSLEFTKSQRIETIFRAAQFWWERYDRRVQVVWRVHISLWTALAALVGLVITGRIPLEARMVTLGSVVFSFILLALHIYYIHGQARMNKLDRDKFEAYYKEFRLLVGISYGEKIEAQSDNARAKSISLLQYANLFAWSVTLILSISLVLASYVAQGANPKGEDPVLHSPTHIALPDDSVAAIMRPSGGPIDSGR